MSGPIQRIRRSSPPVTAGEMQSGYFNGSDEELTFTPSLAGVRTKGCVSVWLRLATEAAGVVYRAEQDANNFTQCHVLANNKLAFTHRVAGADVLAFETVGTYRDINFLHAVWTWDTTLSTPEFKLYVLGEEPELTVTVNTVSQNDLLFFSAAVEHSWADTSYDGHMSQATFLDGTIPAITQLGSTFIDGNARWWQVAADESIITLANSSGTNSCMLDFQILGDDRSDYSNDYLPVNMNAANLFLNTPNRPYCTLNHLDKGPGANILNPLQAQIVFTSIGDQMVACTFWMHTGSWYWEVVDPDGAGGSAYSCSGVVGQDAERTDYVGKDVNGWGWAGNGTRRNGSSSSYGGGGYTDNDELMFAYNADLGAMWVGKNGAWLNGATKADIEAGDTTNAIFTNITGPVCPAISTVNLNAIMEVAFEETGLRHIAQKPEGFNTLTPKNYAEPVEQGANEFNALARVGTGADVEITSEVPDPAKLWIFNRTAANTDSHKVVDGVRGPTAELLLDTTLAESTNNDGVQSFNSTSYALQAGAGGYNDFGESFVDWIWREGVMLDIVAYTGNSSANQAVAHTLPTVPKAMIVRSRSVGPWYFYHHELGNGEALQLDSNAAAASSGVWGNTTPTLTQFTVGGVLNTSGEDYIAYLLPDLPGLMRVGSFIGKSSSYLPYVSMGGRIQALLIKNADTASKYMLFDTARSLENPVDDYLRTDIPNAEEQNTSFAVDFLSDGIKLRSTESDLNGSGNRIVYLGFLSAQTGGDHAPLPACFPKDLDAVLGDVAPFFTANPTITGTVEIGETLTAVSGAYDGTEPITVTYDWLDDLNNVLATNSPTYVIQASDYQSQIKARQNLSNGSGSAAAESALTVSVPGVAPSISGSPGVTVSGTQVGDDGIDSITSGGASGVPTPVSTYDLRNVNSPTIVHDSDPLTYVWQPADEGETFFVRETATNAEGSAQADSANIGPIDPADSPPVNTVAPVASSPDLNIGSVITATSGTWTGFPVPTYEYEFRDGTGIVQARGPSNTYTTVTGDVGETIFCRVYATNSSGTVTADSNGLGPWVDGSLFAPVNTVPPVISAATDLLEGSTLNTTDGTWSANPAPTFAYRWTRNGTPIAGATSSSYVIQAADIGQTIRSEVQATNSEGSSAYVASSNSLVPQSLPVNTVAPVISSADLEVGTPFNVTDNGTWTGSPASFTFSYQWKSGAANVGTDSASYTPVVGDIGNLITCEVTASNAAGPSASAAVSNALGPVIADSGGGPWEPPDLGAALAGWYDATDNATVTTAGGAVEAWTDKSANTNDWAQTVVADRATHTLGGPITFDAADNIEIAASSGLQNAVAHWFIVRSSTDPASLEVHADVASYFLVCEDGSTTNLDADVGNPAYWDNGTEIVAPTRNLLHDTYNTGTIDVIGVTDLNLSGTAWATNLKYGGYTFGFDFAGDLYEIVVVHGALSVADRQKIEGYLAHKHGTESKLPAGHPYKSSPP